MTRSEYISQNFIDLKLNKSTLYVYAVRASILRAVKEILPLFHGKIIDVGCGIQPYRELLLNSNKKISHYIGVDFADSIYVEYAMEKPDYYWDGKTIPLADQSFDCAMATELLEHCADPEMVLTEIYRVLKPGGVLFFTVPFVWPLHLTPYDEYRYTPFSISRHLKSSGFADIELKALGGFDAALAQMLSIWVCTNPMSKFKRKWLIKIIVLMVDFLLKRDSKFDRSSMFYDSSMYTGISGVAFKKS
jgi:ubiquinone/menaquinone biosynthesis C-methylase UbiE